MNTNTIGYVITETTMQASDINIKYYTDNGKPVAEVILQDTDVDNRNGRYYASADIDPELESERMIELLNTGNLKGENGHPMSNDLKRQSTIDPNLVCVKYLKIWKDGNLIKALCTGTNNQAGKEFDQDLISGEKPSFSLRALGSIENKNGHAMVKNIKIITWDRVIFPSHKRAYTQGLVTESTDYSAANGNKVIMANGDKGTLIPITNKEVMQRIKQESANINMIMDKFDTLYESMTLSEDHKNIQLIDKFGSMMVVNLESHVRDSIMDYCYKK